MGKMFTCEGDVLPEDLRVRVDRQRSRRVEGTDRVRHVTADARHEVLLAVVGDREPVVACRVHESHRSRALTFWCAQACVFAKNSRGWAVADMSSASEA